MEGLGGQLHQGSYVRGTAMQGMSALVAVGLTVLLLAIWPDPVAQADDQVMCTKAGDCTNIAPRGGDRRRWTATRRPSQPDSRPTTTEVDKRVLVASKK